MPRYAVLVKAKSPSGAIQTLARIGGGGHLQFDDRFYPTILWRVCDSAREVHFDPSDRSHGGPFEVVEVLQYHSSDDPMNASIRGFAADYSSQEPFEPKFIQWYDDVEGHKREEPTPIYECNESMYFNQLDCVPPHVLEGSFFGVGEPLDHRQSGEATRAWFTCRSKRYFMMIGTESEARSAFADLKAVVQ